MGDEVIGHVSALQYSAALENPKNEAFVKKYRAKFGKVPSYYSETNLHDGAQMIHEIIKNNKGNFPGQEEFRETARRAQVGYHSRPRKHRRDAQTRCRTSTSKRSRRRRCSATTKEELWNTVIKTYPNVTQFGQFNKEEFLKTPVYSRDFPPCKFMQLAISVGRGALAPRLLRCNPRGERGEGKRRLRARPRAAGPIEELRRPARGTRRHAHRLARRTQGDHRGRMAPARRLCSIDHRNPAGHFRTSHAVRSGCDQVAEPIAARRWEWRARSKSPAFSRSSRFSRTCSWRSRACGGRNS